MKNLNSVLRDPAIASALNGSRHDIVGLERIISDIDPDRSEAEKIGYRNASQAWNHNFYWNSMRPPKANMRSGMLEEMLLDAMSFSASNVLGTPWLWIVEDSGDLAVRIIDGVDTPLAYGLRPLAVCDLWEHAYYLDYQADKSRYIRGFCNLINWDFIERNRHGF